MFYDILKRKNNFLVYKNKKFKKVEKLTFFQTWPLGQLLSKIGQYSNFFCLGNIGQENLFHDILERKNNFLGYKNKKFKKSKIDIFPRAVVHAFCPKLAIFLTFV